MRAPGRRILWFSTLAGALLLAACTNSSEGGLTGLPDLGELGDGRGVQSADGAPNLTARLLDGGTFSLAEHLAADGRPVFLNLWASWCIPCRAEMPAIDASAAANPQVLHLGVAVQDSLGKASDFVSELGVDYPLAFDEDGSVDRDWAPIALPISYFISSDGIVLERIFGERTTAELDAKIEELFGS